MSDSSATCRLPVHEYFQVSGVSKSRLTDNIEKRIIDVYKRQAPHRSDVLPYKIPLPERKPVSDERLCWGLPDLFLTEQI